MFAPKSRLSVPLALALALGAGVSACAGTLEEQDAGVRGSPELLASLQPADIAIAPLRNQTGDDTVPLALIRGAFAEALVEQLYSPLDHDYVDGNRWAWDPLQGGNVGHGTKTASVIMSDVGSATGEPFVSERRIGLQEHRLFQEVPRLLVDAQSLHEITQQCCRLVLFEQPRRDRDCGERSLFELKSADHRAADMSAHSVLQLLEVAE